MNDFLKRFLIDNHYKTICDRNIVSDLNLLFLKEKSRMNSSNVVDKLKLVFEYDLF